MKPKVIILLVFIMCSFAAQTQKSGMLKGKWKFKDVGDKEQVDSVGLKMIQKFFSDMKLEFKDNKQYSATLMGRNEEGTWSLDKKETHIILINSKGKENSMELINVTSTQLWIRIGTSGKGFIIMEKE